MLINGYGQHFGLLSGGCLEADILRRARRVMQRGETELLVYDGSDEDDWSFRLGIGCGGKVFIMCAGAAIIGLVIYAVMYMRLRRTIPALAKAT